VVNALKHWAATGHGDVRKLKGTDPPEWRLRVGDLRVRMDLAPLGVARILRILPRGKAYR